MIIYVNYVKKDLRFYNKNQNLIKMKDKENIQEITIELLDEVFTLLFWDYNDTSAHNELLPIKQIIEVLKDHNIPYKETNQFFKDDTWGLYTPFGFIYQQDYSPNQIYSFSYSDWVSIAKDIIENKDFENETTEFNNIT